MKLLKPEWVSHGGKAIFAVDIHPDASRFATGGQGEDAGLVIIWNVSPVVSEILEHDENTPKVLCQIDDHTACVNTLRWSNSGNFLATGSDDKMVMLWGLTRSSSSTVFGTGGSVVNVENWKCAHVLRGHSGDVLDIAWSPDDSYIATGSVDNTIIVWNALKLPEILHTIKDHQGLVKGVTFDPVGKYLASQSDDKSLCIWNTSDWKLEKKIIEPFTESSGTTHALRLDWSPNGQYIVSAHAMNNGGPVAKIVERNGWKAKMDFVGHRKAVTCVRFNERLLCTDDSSKSQYVCCAIGSRDRSISVWLTSLKRPLVVIHDLFENSVMDMAWSNCGYFMLACSLDGTVAYLDFSKEELGECMSVEEKYIYHKKTYGTSIKASKSLILSSIVENPDFLKHQRKEQEQHMKKAKLLQQKLSTANTSGVLSPVGKIANVKHSGGLVSSSSNDKMATGDILQKQKEGKTKEGKTKEGKRRIVPMMLEPPPNFSNDASVFVDFNTEGGGNSGFDKSQLGSNCTDIPKSTSIAKPFSTILTSPVMTTSALKASSSITTTTTSLTVKRKSEAVLTTPSKKSKKKKSKDKEKTANETPQTPVKSQVVSSEKQSSGFYEPSILIPYPEPESKLSIQVSLSSFKGDGNKATLEVENNLQPTLGVNLHYLRCLVQDVLTWETCFNSPVCVVSANELMVCTSCQNNTVHVFSPKGRRLFPPLLIDGNISQLQCHKQFLLVISSIGSISVWNMKTKSILIKKEELAPIFKDSTYSITRTFISDSGCPIITLSDHTVYSYDNGLCSWLLLTTADDSVRSSADISSCINGSQPKGALHSVQLPLNRLSKQTVRGLRINPTKQQTSTISYLEGQVTSSLSLNSPEEYHFWLMTYTRYIVQAGDESRLRDICEDLLRPINKSNIQRSSKLLCYERKDLLKDMLPIIASNLRFQRFYSEIQQQLEDLMKR